MNTNHQRTIQLIGALTGFAGVILQYTASALQFQTSMVQFLSYFTILTNLLVSVYFTALLFPKSKLYNLATLASTGTAITVYILVVGLVYQTVLRSLYHPQGLFLVSDNLVHGWMPLFTLGYWIRFTYGNFIEPKSLITWLYYPLAFLFYSLLRGHFTGWYPYPFLDVTTLGYGQVWVNSGAVSALFVILFLLFITLTNRKHARNNLK